MFRATIFGAARRDLETVVARDPSCRSRWEALLHPAVPAIWIYRLAHRLHACGFRLLARALSNLAKMWSGGIEIHPGARIGQRLFIDHGTGVVVGETAVIGDDVTIFHQVTLGAVGWWKDRSRPDGQRRHPVIGNRVVIGANATILGPVTVGDDAVVGAQALVMTDIPAGGRALAPTATIRLPQPSSDQAQPRELLRTIASAGCW